MSRFLEIGCTNLEAVIHRYEELEDRSAELRSFEPRRFELGSLALAMVPVPAHLQRWLALDGTSTCLQMSDDLVYHWQSLRDEQAVVTDVKRLLELVTASSIWVVVYEAGRGSGVREVNVEAAELFGHVDNLLLGKEATDVTILSSARSPR